MLWDMRYAIWLCSVPLPAPPVRSDVSLREQRITIIINGNIGFYYTHTLGRLGWAVLAFIYEEAGRGGERFLHPETPTQSVLFIYERAREREVRVTMKATWAGLIERNESESLIRDGGKKGVGHNIGQEWHCLCRLAWPWGMWAGVWGPHHCNGRTMGPTGQSVPPSASWERKRGGGERSEFSQNLRGVRRAEERGSHLSLEGLPQYTYPWDGRRPW